MTAVYRHRTQPPSTRNGHRYTFKRIGTSGNDWAAVQALMTAHYDTKDY